MAGATPELKWVYLFNEIEQVEARVGDDWEKVRGLLGGKGANLADMTRLGVPVPPGFTVTTEACAVFDAGEELPPGLGANRSAPVHREGRWEHLRCRCGQHVRQLHAAHGRTGRAHRGGWTDPG